MPARRPIRVDAIKLILWTVGGGLILLALIGAVLTLGQGRISPSSWQNLVVAGIALGSVYALIALGYTLVYGILFMINFAHGEVFMWGAFSSWFMAAGLNEVGLMSSNPWLAFALRPSFGRPPAREPSEGVANDSGRDLAERCWSG